MKSNKSRIILCGKAASGKDHLRKILEGRGFKYGVSYTTRPPRQGEIDGKDYLFVDPSNKDNTFWYNASDLMVTPPSVILAQHCDNAGWKKSIGVGTFNSGSDFPADSSYITVPKGLSATLTTGSGQVEKITGPNVFNFCSKGDFNDNVKKIVVVTGSTPA
jgi:hypothetical protein